MTGDPYALTGPCRDCPFRTDRHFYLSPERAREIADNVRETGAFPCHKTVDYDGDPRDHSREQQCAGHLIVAEREGQPGQLTRIAERVGLYDRTRLDMAAPVFDTFDEFVAAMEADYAEQQRRVHAPLPAAAPRLRRRPAAAAAGAAGRVPRARSGAPASDPAPDRPTPPGVRRPCDRGATP